MTCITTIHPRLQMAPDFPFLQLIANLQLIKKMSSTDRWQRTFERVSPTIPSWPIGQTSSSLRFGVDKSLPRPNWSHAILLLKQTG